MQNNLNDLEFKCRIEEEIDKWRICQEKFTRLKDKNSWIFQFVLSWMLLNIYVFLFIYLMDPIDKKLLSKK